MSRIEALRESLGMFVDGVATSVSQQLHDPHREGPEVRCLTGDWDYSDSEIERIKERLIRHAERTSHFGFSSEALIRESVPRRR